MPCPECREQVVVDGRSAQCPVCGQGFVWVGEAWYPVDETDEPERGGYAATQQGDGWQSEIERRAED